MKLPLVIGLATLGLGAVAGEHAEALPSCNLPQQQEVVGQPGGEISDPRQAHVFMRANILQADIGSARKARRITQDQADQLWQRVEHVRGETLVFAKRQGFLSAAQRASHDREFDAIARQICPGIEG